METVESSPASMTTAERRAKLREEMLATYSIPGTWADRFVTDEEGIGFLDDKLIEDDEHSLK
jgi:hypothetical protein